MLMPGLTKQLTLLSPSLAVLRAGRALARISTLHRAAGISVVQPQPPGASSPQAEALGPSCIPRLRGWMVQSGAGCRIAPFPLALLSIPSSDLSCSTGKAPAWSWLP